MRLLGKLRHRLALAVISTVVITTAQGAAAVTILKNFTLIDGTGHVPVSASALIIGDDGHLAWVGLASQLKVPEGGKVVDLTGKFVMPGLRPYWRYPRSGRRCRGRKRFYSSDCS
jgi:hypothetical protein